MKLRLMLVLFCLLGIGMLSHAQSKKKERKPMVENGADALPVTVKSTRHRKPPPPPPIRVYKDGKPLPAPKVHVSHLKVPPPPPHKPINEKANKPVKPNEPPPADNRG